MVAQLDIMGNKTIVNLYPSTVPLKQFGFNKKKYVNLKMKIVHKEHTYLDHLVNLMLPAKMGKPGILLVTFVCALKTQNGMEIDVSLV